MLRYVRMLTSPGKTVLASKIINKCEAVVDSKTIYFYARAKDPTKNTFTSIVKSLISQALFLSQEILLPICCERQKKSSEVILKSSNQATTLLESCLLKIAQQDIISNQKETHQRQYIIIDGLDE